MHSQAAYKHIDLTDINAGICPEVLKFCTPVGFEPALSASPAGGHGGAPPAGRRRGAVQSSALAAQALHHESSGQGATAQDLQVRTTADVPAVLDFWRNWMDNAT